MKIKLFNNYVRLKGGNIYTSLARLNLDRYFTNGTIVDITEIKDEQLLNKKRKREDRKEDSKEKKSRNFISKEDVKVNKILTVKKIKNILYAEVKYTEKGSKKKEMKGLIPTTEFIDSEPELMLKFYEDNIEFTKNAHESSNDE